MSKVLDKLRDRAYKHNMSRNAETSAAPTHKLVDCFGEVFKYGSELECENAWLAWGDEDPESMEIAGICVVPADARFGFTPNGNTRGWHY